MPKANNFREFLSSQADIFRHVFKGIDESYPSTAQIVFKNLDDTSNSLRTKEENTKTIIEKTIQEVKYTKNSSNTDSSMKTELLKKDVKRLTRGVHKGIEKINKIEGVESRKVIKKKIENTEISKEPIIFDREFEIID